jgi:acid phosphatase class B
MRRALPVLFALALMLALAVPATAATPSPARMAAQIRTLQGQVKTLQKAVKKMNTAVMADALQGSSPTVFGTTPVADFNSCSDLQKFTTPTPTIVRQPNTATVNVFQELLNIFKS